jgi:2-hydroxychromene-2-carboxylate isomerase
MTSTKNNTNHRPRGAQTDKGPYTNFERGYFAKRFQVPFAPSGKNPDPFPQFTLHTMRSMCALQLVRPDKLHEYMTALCKRFWIDLEPVSKPEVFGKVLAEVLGSEEEAKEVLRKTGEEEAKELLKKNTEEAFKSGSFGSPWFEAVNPKGEKQGFWGINHLGLLIEFLGLEKGGDRAFRSLL